MPRSTMLLLLALPLLPAAGTSAQAASRTVLINRVVLPAATVAELERVGGARIPDGRYWYDAACGAWGLEGGYTRGFIAPGLPLGGPLPADISGGTTGVYINGRQLPQEDLLALSRLTGPVQPGRYWLDAQGNAGLEGGPAITNLRVLAAQLYRQNGGTGENYGDGSGAYHNPRTGIGIITDGGGAAVFTP